MPVTPETGYAELQSHRCILAPSLTERFFQPGEWKIRSFYSYRLHSLPTPHLLKKSGIGGVIENREVGGEGENCEKDSEMGGNKTEESDTEESDHFEDCPNFPGKK